MPAPQSTRVDAAARRRGIWAANVNAALWAIGNGLVSSTLVIYLALDFGATGIAISLLLAARRFVGALRLFVPALVARLDSRKLVCISALLASTVFLMAVPMAALPELRSAPALGITILATAWCTYHVLEYIGTVALWSWLGDLMPRPIRGRLLGRRQQFLVIGRIGGLVASVALAACWTWLAPDSARWAPLALSAWAGGLLMMVSLVPLALVPALGYCPSAMPTAPFRSLLKPFADRNYRRLIVFYCWFSVVNGITATAQNMFPRNELGISYQCSLGMQGLMRAGQSVVAPVAGRWCDRIGSWPVMFAAQLIVATGPLFFLFATPSTWWILIGAHVAWIAYAGLNVGLDSIQLKLADESNNIPYLAVLFTITDIFNGLATIAGGLFYDALAAGGEEARTIYIGMFLVGWIGRTLVAGFILRLNEPGSLRL
jgi:MFS family permease